MSKGKQEVPVLTVEERERVRTDEILQEEVGAEIGKSGSTLYQWAKYFPERFHPAALKTLREYIKNHPIQP